MNQLSDRDLELAKKHGLMPSWGDFNQQKVADFLAERDAEPTEDLLTIAYMSGFSDGKKQQPNAEAYAYAVYFPDEPTEVLCHNLDELIDDLTNRQHKVTKLFHVPSQGITRADLDKVRDQLLNDLEGVTGGYGMELVRRAFDAILAEINPAQGTKL